MKRTLAFLVAAAGIILTHNVRAQESVCDLFSHLETSDGQQLVVTGDLIISKDVTILGAADCDNHYTSALSDSQRIWPTALLLHPSTAVNPVQLRQIQNAAAEADRLRSQGGGVSATAIFSGRLRLSTTGDIPAEVEFDSFENLKVEALPDAASLEIIPICALFQNLSSWKGKRLAVRGEFVSTMEGWWIAGNCQGTFVTDGYRWPVGISLGVPAYHSRETAELYQAKWPAVSKGENLKGMPDVIKTLTFVGTLRLRSDYRVTCVPSGTYRAFGYGHQGGAAAELIVESIRDFDLAPRSDGTGLFNSIQHGCYRRLRLSLRPSHLSSLVARLCGMARSRPRVSNLRGWSESCYTSYFGEIIWGPSGGERSGHQWTLQIRPPPNVSLVHSGRHRL